MSGSTAPCAAENGASTSCTSTSSAAITDSGIVGSAITATSTARAASHTTITRRRGYRSASHDSSAPDTSAGSIDNAYVAALSAAEPVRWYTRIASATRASWSPATESRPASHTTRNSRTAKADHVRPGRRPAIPTPQPVTESVARTAHRSACGSGPLRPNEASAAAPRVRRAEGDLPRIM